MKRILIQLVLPLLLIGSIFACRSMDRGSVGAVAPELLPQYEAAEAREVALKADLVAAEEALRAAEATPEPEDDSAAEAMVRALAPQVDDLERQFRDLEVAFNRRQAEPFLGPLDAFIPGAKEMVLFGLLPLVGKRGRKHYGNMIRNTSKGQLLTAMGDIVKAYGVQHSTPASAAAAQPT